MDLEAYISILEWFVLTVADLDGARLVLVIFRVGLQVIDVDRRQTRDEQLQLLLSEDGDQPLGDDLVESLEEGCQLLTDCT